MQDSPARGEKKPSYFPREKIKQRTKGRGENRYTQIIIFPEENKKRRSMPSQKKKLQSYLKKIFYRRKDCRKGGTPDYKLKRSEEV